MKRVMLGLLALFLLMQTACAERIERRIFPDVSDVPECQAIVFDMSLEKPEDFPFPVPCYQTAYAAVDIPKIRALLDECGLPKPEGERWMKGRDDINRRNIVFGEVDHGYYQLHMWPDPPCRESKNHPKSKEIEQAEQICLNFLEAAEIDNIKTPFSVVMRTDEYMGNSLGRSRFSAARESDVQEYRRWKKIDNDEFTGIGFCYQLGGLPVAVSGLYDPTIADRKDTYSNYYGQMTVRDDGVITYFELNNARKIVKELPAHTERLCSWEEAADEAINYCIYGKYFSDAYTRVRVCAVEPNLAITPGGQTFPVWRVEVETEQKEPELEYYYFTFSIYVDARTGKMVPEGENMTP